MNWIIENKTDNELAWSNEDGWTDTTFDTFSDEEKLTINLPMDGAWVQVPWAIS